MCRIMRGLLILTSLIIAVTVLSRSAHAEAYNVCMERCNEMRKSCYGNMYAADYKKSVKRLFVCEQRFKMCSSECTRAGYEQDATQPDEISDNEGQIDQKTSTEAKQPRDSGDDPCHRRRVYIRPKHAVMSRPTDAGSDLESSDDVESGSDVESGDEIESGSDQESSGDVESGSDVESAGEASDENISTEISGTATCDDNKKLCCSRWAIDVYERGKKGGLFSAGSFEGIQKSLKQHKSTDRYLCNFHSTKERKSSDCFTTYSAPYCLTKRSLERFKKPEDPCAKEWAEEKNKFEQKLRDRRTKLAEEQKSNNGGSVGPQARPNQNKSVYAPTVTPFNDGLKPAPPPPSYRPPVPRIRTKAAVIGDRAKAPVKNKGRVPISSDEAADVDASDGDAATESGDEASDQQSASSEDEMAAQDESAAAEDEAAMQDEAAVDAAEQVSDIEVFAEAGDSVCGSDCALDSEVIYWKGVIANSAAPTMAPSYCAAAATYQCFIASGAYAGGSCAGDTQTSVTRELLVNGRNDSLNKAKALGTGSNGVRCNHW